MMTRLLKTYTISVTIQEGDDEFWDSLRGKSGADDVVGEVCKALIQNGWSPEVCSVRLERFEERAPMFHASPIKPA